MKEQNHVPEWCDEELLRDDDFFDFEAVHDPYSWDGEDNDACSQVPPELHGKMAQARLIAPCCEGTEPAPGAWEVTPLGKQCGLTVGELPLDGNRSCRTFFVRDSSRKELLTLLAETRFRGKARKVIPLAERLSLLAVGQPSNDAYGIMLLKQLGRMPLEQYMARCPDKLKLLRKELPGPPVNTVQEAAARISAAWRQDEGTTEQRKNWIWYLLASPAGCFIPQFPSYERRD